MRKSTLSAFTILLTFLCFAQSGFAQTQTLTFSTYYPAPFGAYDRLRLVPRASLGAAACNQDTVGTFYTVDPTGVPLFCTELTPGTYGWTRMISPWVQVNNDIFPADTVTNPNLAVGIGTSEPKGFLHIYKSAIGLGPALYLESIENGITGIRFAKRIGANTREDMYLGTTDNINGDFIISKLQEGGAGADPNRADFVISRSTGRVGIGTISPQTLLNVRAQSHINHFVNDPNVIRLTSFNGSKSIQMRIGDEVDLESVNAHLIINGGTCLEGGLCNQNVIILPYGGQMALGTPVPHPGSMMTIASPNDATAALHWRAAGAQPIGFLGSNGNDALIGATFNSGGALKFRTDNQDRMTVANNGSIGIGTTNPMANLHIKGITHQAIFLDGNTVNGEKGMRIHYNNLSSHPAYEHGVIDVRGRAFAIRGVQTATGGDAAQTTHIHINLLNNNIGIGTTTPQSKLDVAGAVRPGNQSVSGACNANTAGSIRYNTAGFMEYCHANTWNPMGSGSGGRVVGGWQAIQCEYNTTWTLYNYHWGSVNGNINSASCADGTATKTGTGFDWRHGLETGYDCPAGPYLGRTGGVHTETWLCVK